MKKLIFFLIWTLPIINVYPQILVDLDPLKRSILQTTTSVTTSATALPATALSGRRSIIVKNTHATAVLYIGSSTVTAGVTSTGGLQLAAGEVYTADLSEDVVLYGIVSSGTIDTNVLEAR